MIVVFTSRQGVIPIFAKMPIFGFLIGCPYGLLNDGGKDRKGDFTYEKKLVFIISVDFGCWKYVGAGCV
jgi:hypothetical protein